MSAVQIDQHVPNLTLPDVNGQPQSLIGRSDALLIINFWSAECDLCREIDARLDALLDAWAGKARLVTIAVHPEEEREQLREAARKHTSGPFLLDEEHAAVQLFGAQTTPHFFVLDAGGVLRYQGAFHNATFRRRVATVHYVQDAVEALLAGRLPPVRQSPAYGCVIMRRDADGR